MEGTVEKKRGSRAILTQLIDAWAHYLRRGRHPAVQLAALAVVLFLAAWAGWALSVEVPIGDEKATLRFRADGGGFAGTSWGLVATAMILLVWGIGWFLHEAWRDRRRRVVVIELRGLRDTRGSSLADAVPRLVAGRREPLLIDLTQGADGVIKDPSSGFVRVSTLPVELANREGGTDRRDFTVVFGALAPVPFTFLAGLLIDDESQVVVMDWDRFAERWRTLDDTDDGRRFQQTGLGAVASGADEVVLAVSVSYQVDLEGVTNKLPNLPVVRLDLVGSAADGHWAAAKQAALAQVFLATAAVIANRGVRRVHLFLAAPSSVAFTFGRVYDRRNLPTVIVYQFQREEDPPFPWGARMPAAGETLAEVVA